MKSYVISIIVKFLLSKGLEYLKLPLDQIKADCESYIRRQIDSSWIEMVALKAFDGAWELIIGEVEKQLNDAPRGFLTMNQQSAYKCRSAATAAICKKLELV